MAKKSSKQDFTSSARFAAFHLIDALLADKKNLAKLKKAFQDTFDDDPVTFYRQFIKPTAEKELVVVPVRSEKALGLRFIFADEEEKSEAKSH